VTLHLCTANPEYDAIDAENLASAVEWAKLELGQELQRRGCLAEITIHTWTGDDTGIPNPRCAGELAAAALNLGQADLAGFRAWDIDRWATDYIRRAGAPIALAISAVG
jgi:hypothetical protein